MIVYLQTFRWTEICLEKNNQYFPKYFLQTISQKLATNQKRTPNSAICCNYIATAFQSLQITT